MPVVINFQLNGELAQVENLALNQLKITGYSCGHYIFLMHPQTEEQVEPRQWYKSYFN